MNRNRQKQKNNKKQKNSKKLICFILVVALLVAGVPSGLFEGLFAPGRTVKADDVVYPDISDSVAWKSENIYTINDIDSLVMYSQAYYSHAAGHQNDTVILAFGTGDTTLAIEGFLPIGTSECPFKGVIKISAASNNKLRIADAFFDYVYDSVLIINSTVNVSGGDAEEGSEKALTLARTRDGTGAPMLARHVIHDDENETVRRWIVDLEPYDNIEQQSTDYCDFAGIIGEMDSDAKLCLVVEDNSNGNIYGTSDVGYLCGSMAAGSSLTIESVTGSNTGYYISTTNGNAGGLVGRMAYDAEHGAATLTLKAGALNRSATVTAGGDGNYAGGIVGENDRGEIVFAGDMESTAYTITNTLVGVAGAGGVFGYYETEAVTFDVSNYSINTKVNGTGSVGGLFGVLQNLDGAIAISATNDSNKTITVDHADGADVNYGGLVGKYLASSLADSLTIGKSAEENYGVAAVTKKSGGNYVCYGGGVGLIDSLAYVKFCGFSLEADNAGSLSRTNLVPFGGLAAKADRVFIDAENVKVSLKNWNNNTFRGGGLVGWMEKGALRLKGEIDLSQARASWTDWNSGSYYIGQIIGYRDEVLAFAEAGTTISRPGVLVDDIGSWGEVIRFDDTKLLQTDVLHVDETAHTVTIEPTNATISNVADYAKTSLCFQIDPDEVVQFRNATYTSAMIAASTITLTGDVDLKGTGLIGFTRDSLFSESNDDIDVEKCVFRGVLDGKNHEIVLDIGGANVYIYQHIYNGLFAYVDNVTVRDLTLSGSANLYVYRGTMYTGALAAKAQNDLTVSGIKVKTVFTHRGTDNRVYLGRLLGEATETIGSISISDSDFSGDITGDNRGNTTSLVNTCIGGVIGRISHRSNQEREWSFTDVALSGTIENTSDRNAQIIGGLIGYIQPYAADTNKSVDLYSDRILTLNGVVADDLVVHGKVWHDNTNTLSSGGLLGYAWYNTDVRMVGNGVTIKGNSEVEMDNEYSGYGDIGGLVYAGTGYWLVEKLDITGLTVTAPTAKSFGMIVNKGWVSKNENGDNQNYYTSGWRSAIYLDVRSDAYHIGDAVDLSNLQSEVVFDELVAYSAYYEESEGNRYSTDSLCRQKSDIMRNGQGIISIQTGLTMDGSQASGSYQAQTERGKDANPYTRYYYNLSDIMDKDTASLNDSQKLMSWGVRQYACRNLQKHFKDPFSTVKINNVNMTDITNVTYNMQGYSWYPVNLDTLVRVNGTFRFYNQEFEGSEALTADKWSSHEATQHYLMQDGLFYDMGKSLVVGDVVLQGTIGTDSTPTSTSAGTGALIYGIIRGGTSTSPLMLNVAGNISLDGIRVYDLVADGYAPLLINQIGDYTTLNINNVTTTSAYQTGSISSAATSLIGNAGINSNSKNINLTFSGIKLDARKEANTPAISNVSGNGDGYNTAKSIFTKSTLLNQFQFASGSSGVYNYTWSEDWGSGDRNVTYGSELNDSTYRNQYYGWEHQYYESSIFTSYNDNNASAKGDFSAFLPYVYERVDLESGKNQLKVNHGASTISGCGTYNDPYMIGNGDLETIADILNGSTSGTIHLPVKYQYDNTKKTEVIVALSNTDLLATKWCDTPTGSKVTHAPFKYADGKYREININQETQEVSLVTDGAAYDAQYVRNYLAGAYYQLKEDIQLSTDFIGLGSVNTSLDNYTSTAFRGVIVGGEGTKIVNKSNNPLVRTSYGCVIRGISIEVNANIVRNQIEKETFTEGNACENYGAVIGQILGGDNIIDGVSVKFAENSKITLKGAYAQIVPVGGYVGVLLNGALIFRNMKNLGETDANAITGIAASTAIVKDSNGNTISTASTNKKWLYVNPIVGRVINGYAVAEENEYRYSEDGSRGTAVTMRNGTKNYSITDIKKPTTDAEKLDVGTYVAIEGASDANMHKTTVYVPDDQALFVLSSLIHSRVTTHCYKDDKNGSFSVCTPSNTNERPYGNYKTTHVAQYDKVGNVTSKADSDYTLSLRDTYTIPGNNASNVLVPYLVENYTSKNADNQYGVFCISHRYTVCDMEFGGEACSYHLPDGFKGIGSLTYNSSSRGHQTDLTISLHKLAGNSKLIELNMSQTVYEDGFDNYLPISDWETAGFGLFNTVRQNRIDAGSVVLDSENYKMKDFSLTGKVDFDVYVHDADNGELDCYYDNVKSSKYASTGAVAGLFGAGEKIRGKLNIENVKLSNMEVNGIRMTGGFFGYIYGGGNDIYNEVYVKNCTADNINISSCEYAAGFAGSVKGYSFYFDGSDSEENSGSFTFDHITNYFKCGSWQYNGAAGIIGYAENDDGMEIIIKNVDIGSKDANSHSEIGYASDTTTDYWHSGWRDVSTGGIVAVNLNKSLEIDNCNIYNVSLYGHRVGGMVAGNAYNWNQFKMEITNSSVYTNNGAVIVSDANDDARAAGGFVGYAGMTKSDTVDKSGLYIDNCLVEGYTIKDSRRVGAICGSHSVNTTYGMPTTLLSNIKIKNCTLVCNRQAGGMIGYLNIPINGYNILTENIQFERYDGDTSKEVELYGHIVGGSETKDIKIAGFSRQGTIYREQMVGNLADTNANRYGANGYVIFADYQGAAGSDSTRSTDRSDINSNSNVALAGTDNFPYVTSSPKRSISATQFLTGDGVSTSTLTYDGSVLKKIIDDSGIDLNAEVAAKQDKVFSTAVTGSYKNTYTSIGKGAIKTLVTALSTNGKYADYHTEMGTQAGVSSAYRFPVIVIDDANKETTTTLLNTYLQLLTNTDYNFARGTLANGTTSASNIFKVELGKCTYNTTTGEFDADFTEGVSCLKNADGKHFYMAKEYDTSSLTGQFSLIDVQFLNPADTTKVAYHLYVPVLVKKMMLYDFDISFMPGTTYRMAPYEAERNNDLIENLGNPVTLEARYIYRQTLEEWQNAVNAGESLLRTYDKKLEVIEHAGAGLPDGTRMVLVDANNHNKFYYGSLEDNGVYTRGTNNYLNLNKFKDSGNNVFQSLQFNDFFDAVATVDNSNGIFKRLDSSADAAVKATDGYYYKLIEEEEEYEGDRFNVELSYKEGVTDNNGFIQEDYYVTFYTNAIDDSIYHLEFTVPATFGVATYPSKVRLPGGRGTTHLFTGDIYTSTFRISNPSTPHEISLEMNDSIGATFTSTVKLTANAGPIIERYLDMDSVNIYQSFLITLNRQEDENISRKGIRAVPTVSVSSYTIDGQDVTDTMTPVSLAAKTVTSNYIELRNNENLKSYLKAAYGNGSVVTIAATFSLKYNSEEDIVAQFPTRDANQIESTVIGTKIGGSSNISANASSAAYSKMFHAAEDSTLYYCRLAPTASLIYSSDDATNENGEYYQLGINARELSDMEILNGYVDMKTLATYNVVQLADSDVADAQSMKITLTMHRKEADGSYNTEEKIAIADYIKADTLMFRNKRDEVLTKSGSSTADTFVYVVNDPINVLDYDADNKLFKIPVTFAVYTGSNNTFEGSGRYYANYMVHLEVKLYDGENAGGNLIGGSTADDHVIYSNAKIFAEVIDTSE